MLHERKSESTQVLFGAAAFAVAFSFQGRCPLPARIEKEGVISVFALFQRFPDEDNAREYIEKIRWEDGVCCPHRSCGGVTKRKRKGCYHCRWCRVRLTVRTGTVFQRSHIPLNEWLYAFMRRGAKALPGLYRLHDQETELVRREENRAAAAEIAAVHRDLERPVAAARRRLGLRLGTSRTQDDVDPIRPLLEKPNVTHPQYTAALRTLSEIRTAIEEAASGLAHIPTPVRDPITGQTLNQPPPPAVIFGPLSPQVPAEHAEHADSARVKATLNDQRRQVVRLAHILEFRNKMELDVLGSSHNPNQWHQKETQEKSKEND